MRTSEKQMKLEETQALNILKSSNYEAWSILMGYFKRRFEYEKNKLVGSSLEFIQVQQGIARAFGEISSIEDDAEDMYKAYQETQNNMNRHF